MRERASGGRGGSGRLLAGLLLWLLAALCVGASLPAEAQVAVTPVSDTVFHADGTAAAGTVLISWPAFTTAAGATVAKGSTSVTLGAGGSFSVSLAPNVGATPAGTFYTVVYHLDDGSVSREYWTVPASTAAVKLTTVRTSVLPTSVAMQTVTKQYVDQAIARAALTGVVPADASPYVEKAGDTMTGPLVLPGDPTSGLQATTKNYVDAADAGLQAGLAQKVSTIPQATQTVTQPSGTQLQTSILNGQLYAKEFQSQTGNDGIANAFNSSDCAYGCTVVADPTYTGIDGFSFHASRTRLMDQRNGTEADTGLNPAGPVRGVQLYATTPAAQRGGYTNVQGFTVTETALTGGNNLFPQGIGANIPYFKTTYSATSFAGYNYTQGQHVLNGNQQHCYGAGDCLLGSQFLYSSGGKRDNADEGTHPFDISVSEDTTVFGGTCTTGCTTGSTQLSVTTTSAGGTQGDGRFLIDKAASKTISTGSITGSGNGPHAIATFTGTGFPVSTLFTTAAQALPQSNNIAPGTVTLPIATSGVQTGYSTNTAAAPAGSGIACVADTNTNGAADNFETAPYTVVDGSHIQLTLNKPHFAAATVAIGGLCGYGAEQTVDTYNGIREVFPVIASTSPTSLFYTGLASANLGVTGGPSAFANISAPITTMQRSGNVVTVNTAGGGFDINGLSVTISGAADASFNGTFVVTTNAVSQFTFAQTGPDASTTGGTAAVLTGGYVLYPMAEVLNVLNASTNQVDGALTLAPNNVAWATGDPVEEPHYFQERMNADTTFVEQYTPRGSISQAAGIVYRGVTGAYIYGWQIYNGAPNSQYFGNGGTHLAPAAGMAVKGAWLTSLDLQAGEQTGITMRCNSHGCNRWNSAYNLFALQSSSSFDTVNYAPTTSTMTFNMGGALYTLSPTSLSAGTINATTLNVTRINGMQAATSSAIGGVTLGPAATGSVLANVASSGSASDLTSGTLDPARLPAGYGSGVCASNVAYSATPTFAVTCANATFHMPLNGNITSESFTGLASGQRITLIFQVGSTSGYTVGWNSSVHGGFVTSSTSGAAGYTQAGKYLVQQLVVDTDGTTLLNPGAINE